MITRETIEEIREKASLVDLIGETVALKRQGTRYMGLCPFHSEKSPSFHVRENDNSYHCFGCGASGNAISFVMETRGMSFPEAVDYLASRYGVEIRRDDGKKQSPATDQRGEFYKITKLAQDFFRTELKRADVTVQEYVRSRGLEERTLEAFGVGFAPRSNNQLASYLTKRGVPDALQLGCGLVRRNSSGDIYDAYRGRLMFPILSDARRIAGFGGRVIPTLLDEEAKRTAPKYINSPESPIYHKNKILFGLPQAIQAIREKKELILVEGYMDVVSLWQCGVQNVLAACGTALTEEHLRRAARLAKSILVLFDGDTAGRNAASRTFPVSVNAEVDVWALFLSDGEDPDTIARKEGEGTGSFLSSLKRVPLLQCYIDSKVAEYRGTTVHDLGPASIDAIARDVAQVLSKVKKPIAKGRLAEQAATLLKLKQDQFDLALGDVRSVPSVSEKEKQLDEQVRAGLPFDVRKLDSLDQSVLLAAMALKGDICDRVLRDAMLCEELHDVSKQFIIEFSSVLPAIVSLSASDRKEKLSQFLNGYGSTWRELWDRAHKMRDEREVNFAQSIEECALTARLRRRNRSVEEKKREIERCQDPEAKERLAIELIQLKRLETEGARAPVG